MKICFLNKNLNIKAGRGRHGFDMVENIRKQTGDEVIVFTEKSSGYNLEKAILRKSYFLRHFPNLFINAFRIRKYVGDCDVIHALDGYPYGVIAALANIGLNKKIIINGIGTYSVLPLDKPIKRTLLKWAYKQADKLICISGFTKKQILKRLRLNNIIVINPGIDHNKFIRPSIYQAGKTRKEKIILSVGALKLRKGYHISIPAMAEIKKKYKNIKYHIVGGRPPKIYLDLAKKYNLEKNIIFFQNISEKNLIELYSRADIFLLTPITINDNDFEGFGLVYLEAGMYGKPVIGTLNCGAEDAVVDGITGLLIPQNDIKKTIEAVLKLLDNPKLAQKLGRNGRKRTQEMSWDKVAKKYIDCYKNL